TNAPAIRCNTFAGSPSLRLSVQNPVIPHISLNVSLGHFRNPARPPLAYFSDPWRWQLPRIHSRNPASSSPLQRSLSYAAAPILPTLSAAAPPFHTIGHRPPPSLGHPEEAPRVPFHQRFLRRLLHRWPRTALRWPSLR